MKRFGFVGLVSGACLIVGLSAQILEAQDNPQFALSVVPDEGTCGSTIPAAPGQPYDDGNGGDVNPDTGNCLFCDPQEFSDNFVEVPRDPPVPGHSWSVFLTTSANPTAGGMATVDCATEPAACSALPDCGDDVVVNDVVVGTITCTGDAANPDTKTTPTDAGAQGYTWSLTGTGTFFVGDVTSNGTLSCVGGRAARGPSCRQLGGFELEELGVVEEGGPNDGNIAAIQAIVLSQQRRVETSVEGADRIAYVRVGGDGPPSIPSEVTGTVEFATARGGGEPVPPNITFRGQSVNTGQGNPMLITEVCSLTLQAAAAPEPDDFIRCDPNDDGINNIADSVWIINELFRGGPATTCQPAADCNDDDMVDMSDAVYGLDYQFMGGPAPSAPFPSCGNNGDATPGNCLAPNATSCP